VAIDKVIFLDRDGVINRDSPEYIKRWEEFEFLPGSLEALRLLTQAGYHLILITNQSIINRGWTTLEELACTHRLLREAVAAAGGQIFDIFFCPHRPDENCDCRKPKPGMILQAQARYGIDLAQTVMIGDSGRDIRCGRDAGCGATLLVRTGYKADVEQTLAAEGLHPDAVTDDLLAAARLILSGNSFPAPRRP
jgi:D-glycero-D-manno-heptose 1,7-bisphosphate phosphatase